MINLLRGLLYLFILLLSFNVSAKNPCFEHFKSLLINALENSLTPGAVILVSSPKMGTLTLAAGFADKKAQLLMKENNNFRIASMSKTFLAVTLLKLAEQHKINLDEKIMNLLPKTIDINRLPNGKTVTVRQLMQMRSGIPNYTDFDAYYDLIDKMAGKTWTPERCVELIYDQKPTFAANESYEYSNTNFSLLQLIVEKLTGKSYAYAIKEQVLAPLHLKSTFVETPQAWPDNYLFTKGYQLENGVVTDVTQLNDGFGLADGGMVTTAADLKVFVQALLQDKTLLTQASLDAMQTLVDEYGLGIYQEEVNGEQAWSHNGLSSGFQGQYYYFPAQKLTIIILTNYFDTDIIESTVARILSTYRSAVQ